MSTLGLRCQTGVGSESNNEAHLQSDVAVIELAALLSAETQCSVGKSASEELAIEGHPVYINPESISVSGTSILITGFPNYMWSEQPARNGARPRVDSIFGLVIGNSDVIERFSVVPLPRAGHIGSPHAVLSSVGGWDVVFAEYSRSIHETLDRAILRLWSGHFDGYRWSNLQMLPMPRHYKLDYPENASLLRNGSELMMAVIADPGGQVLIFRHRQGGWSWERVEVTGTGQYPEPVGVSQLAFVSSDEGPILVVEKNDVSEGSISQSLFAYEQKESGWDESKILSSIRRPITSSFSVVPSGSAEVISWVSDNQAGSRFRS